MAGRIPQAFIDDLLARADIVEVIDSYVPLRKAGRNHQALCPFHEEKTPSFTVSQDKQFYHCFGCGANGTVISFVMELNGLGFVEAIEDLAGRYGLEIPREAGYQPASRQHDELYGLLEQAAQFYREQLQGHKGRAIDYLENRGISGTVVEDYEIGYAPPGWQRLLNALGKSAASRTRMAEAGLIKRPDRGDDTVAGNRSGAGTSDDAGRYYDRFRDRIMFPIRDQRGRVIGFGGRALSDEDNPKYLNSPETPLFHKGRELYGLFQARRQNKKPESLHVVEGYMDVIALAQHGVNNTVATLGTAVTENHLEKLFRVVNRITFCFDGDNAGKTAARRSLEITIPQLREGRQALFNFMPEGHDPDSFIRRQGAEQFLSDENYVPLSDFLLDSITSETGTTTRESRANFLDMMLPYLNKMPRSGLHRLLLKDVASIAKIDIDSIDKLLRDYQRGEPIRQKRYRTPIQKEKTNLVSKVISYILSDPEVVQSVGDTAELSDIPVPGVDFLIDLIDLIHSNSGINCAGILERWRDSRYEQRLKELVSASDLLREEPFDLELQFLDAIEKLKSAKARQSIQEIARKPPSQLSDEAKKQLRRRYPSDKK